MSLVDGKGRPHKQWMYKAKSFFGNRLIMNDWLEGTERLPFSGLHNSPLTVLRKEF